MVHRACRLGAVCTEMENKMAEKDTGSRAERVAEARPVRSPDLQNTELQALLQELDRPLDQAVVDRGLLRLAAFVAGRQ